MGERRVNELKKSAKAEARKILINLAKKELTTTYKHLALKIGFDPFRWNDRRFYKLLEDLSVEEKSKNRGMISALVVCERKPRLPGIGFFRLAEGLGCSVENEEACWKEQRDIVFAAWRE